MPNSTNTVSEFDETSIACWIVANGDSAFPLPLSKPSESETYQMPESSEVSILIDRLNGSPVIPAIKWILSPILGGLEKTSSEIEKFWELFSDMIIVLSVDKYKVVNSKLHGQFKFTKNFLDILKMYRYMKQNEERFGMNIKLFELLKVIRAV